MRASTPALTRRERRLLERLDRPRGRPKARRPERRRLRSPLVIASGLAVGLGLAAIFVAGGFTAPRDGTLKEPTTSYSDVVLDGATVGSARAPVVMELYADFQCPACRMFAMTELPRLVHDFVAPGILRIEAKDIDILGRGATSESRELAAGAACAAEQGRYWTFHDLVFWNQGRENRGDHDAAFISRVGAAAGLDPATFATCFARGDVRAAVTNRTTEAVAAGLTSTPTLIVNGQRIAGLPDYGPLAALIRQLADSSPSPSKP